MRARFIRTNPEDIIFRTLNTTFMLLLVVVTIYPFVNTLAVSLNEGVDTLRGGIFLWPRVLSFKNYLVVFLSGTIFHAFFISVAKTVISVVLNIFLTAMLAYCISRKEYIFNKFITIVFVLTMYFSAGLIPYFLLIKTLGLYGNFLVYIIPGMISAFNAIVVRTYIETIPESFVESAQLDGAGHFRIFLQIIFPLCTPALAVIGMFTAIAQWNSWFDTLIFCSSKQELSTLQYELQRLLASSVQMSTAAAQYANATLGAEMAKNMIPPISLRASITIVATVPILCVYPFLQKYFIVGLNIGGVKE